MQNKSSYWSFTLICIWSASSKLHDAVIFIIANWHMHQLGLEPNLSLYPIIVERGNAIWDRAYWFNYMMLLDLRNLS